MKRFTLFMAVIVCLAISAMAQNADQPLSPALWKQGVATCAHYTAHARGFGKKIEEIKSQYPQGYTLDNLNNVYSNQGRRWEKIYNEFKKEEGKNGSINDLKELVTPQIWKLVEPEFQAFITDHPELANAVPESENPDGENAEAVQEDSHAGMPPVPAGDRPRDRHHRPHGGPSCAANLPLWLGILGSLLGLCALLTALSNRGKVKEMERKFAREIDRTNANLQEFSTDAADQMKALSIRLTGKKFRHQEDVVADEAPETFEADETPEEEVEEAVEAVAEAPAEEPFEPMTLFMGKPDENDDFTRVGDSFEQGNSIYVLNTEDGLHGTFEVIDKPEVHRFALMMPADNLIRACSGNAIQIPSGNRIITDRAGEAEFIDGKWHVVVKAIIHYEG